MSESRSNTNAVNKTFQFFSFFSLDDAFAVTDRMLCVPEVYGPALSRDHVVFGAAFTTVVAHQW